MNIRDLKQKGWSVSTIADELHLVALWRLRFGSSLDIAGRTLEIDGKKPTGLTIVGRSD